MSELSLEVGVGDGLSLPLPPETVEEAVRWTLAQEGVDRAELSVVFLSDTEIAALNEQYLDHEGPTDVISFPLHVPGQPPLGDVYVGLEQALRQAGEIGVDPSEELLRLAIHGTLHVLGHDHPETDARVSSAMWRRQERLVRRLAR